MSIPAAVVVLGAITGLLYGLLAVGLVLVYRSNRIVNFAHGQIGVFAAAVFGMATTRWSVPYWVGFPLALALGAAVAMVAELAVIRRLRNAPNVMSIVATLGVGQFLVALALAVNGATAGNLFPQPPGLPEFDIGALRVTRAYTAMIVLAPLAVVGIALLLRLSRVGVAVRAAAANPEAARMAGIPAARMSSLAWAVAGALSAMTAVLVAPVQGVSGGAFGPNLLLRALAAAVLGRMVSLPVAFAAGIGIGVVEGVLFWNDPNGGTVELVLFAVIALALLARRATEGRRDDKGSWAAVQAATPIDLAGAPWAVRHLGTLVSLVAVAVAAALPAVITNNAAIILVGIFGFAIVGLSIGIVTGLAGQLSLGQFALAAVGATISYHVASRTGNYGLSFLYAGLGAAAASLMVGLPALRLRGLMLAVTTLGFALVVPAWLLRQSWMLGSGVDPGRPIVAGFPLDTGKRYYELALAVLVITGIVARNVRRGGFGRLLVAVRDNEDTARSFTVRAAAVKLQGFLLAGFIAGVGGAVYGHALTRIAPSTFPTASSVDVAVMTVVGGVGVLAGPLVGALYYHGIPAFVPLDAAGLAGTQLFGLVLILYLPGGIAQGFVPLRDRLLRRLAARTTPARVPATRVPVQAPTVRVVAPRRPPARRDAPVLEAVNLAKRFGGLRAVDGVSFAVTAGQTLGLIGPNGAGKTTTFELLAGFTRPDAGVVRYLGDDVTSLPPEQRGRRGLIRSFQDAALFPTMTVTDVVKLALEHRHPTAFFASTLGRPRSERVKAGEAAALVDRMGLGPYRDTPVRALSTGTRRITELACMVALEPTVLLLDEPSSGVAQRETEALGQLLVDLKGDLDMTLVVIEHDIPLVMSLADHVVVMDAGHVISAGPPSVVQADPVVVDAYLGGSVEAVQRSGVTARPRPVRRRDEPLRAASSPATNHGADVVRTIRR